MPTENDLKNLFADSAAPNHLDAKRIISRSRARRLPRQIGAGGIGALAVTGIGVLGFQSFNVAQPISMSDQSAESAPSPLADGDSIMAKRVAAEQINLCGGGLAEISPSFYGLQLDVTFPESVPAGTEPVVGAVRLTNTSDTRVTGSTNATPAITLSQDGLVLWHSNGAMIYSLAIVDLAPGESIQYPATFTPVQCDVEDDLTETFRSDLPAVAPGAYDLSALIYFSPDATMVQTGTTELDLVGGPVSSITIG